MNKDDVILEVCNLTVAFDGRKVVEDVSYTLKRGRTLGIVGESGSGKSVSTLALMGLLPRQVEVSGKAWLTGEMATDDATSGETILARPDVAAADRLELLSLSEEQLRMVRGGRIAMIFQEPMTSLNPVKRCGEQVAEMLRLHETVEPEETRRRVLQLFEEVRLPRPERLYDSYPHEISGGQKQRVMIAMALICRPELIIADEPTTALDVTVQKTILELLRELQQRHNLSIIFITHDLGVVAQIADDVMVMYRGHVVEQGRAERVLFHPQHPYTQGLLACRPPRDSRPRRLPTVADFMEGHGAVSQQTAAAPLASEIDADDARQVLLSVRNLDVTYTTERNLWGRPRRQFRAVKGMSFDVYRGETLGLVGESGCGKTTLGRAILQLVEHSSGSIVYDGKRLDDLSTSELRGLRTRMQIIFQDPYSSLNPRMTVGQTLMEPLQNYRRFNNQQERRRHVLDLMERVGLEPSWFDRYPHEFSGGQRQRICIARALVLEPELVICDESVSALDVSVQAQVLNLLNELKETFHYTYIFISHDLSVVHFLSDRILVMRDGELVEMGDSDGLFHHPKEAYTKQLIDAIPSIG